ncbi:MAG: carbohydrate binding family 9 domain-containing protein [Bacteroidetes bacterium]|nr:carbohydrate binding family 9 domain-containing protein [Bacteroidota bacterium]
MYTRKLILAFFLLFQISAYAADPVPKQYQATRSSANFHIDGILDEEAWKAAAIAGDFMQLDPAEGKPVSQKTEVRLMYDNTSIYIGAMMHDTSPDSILHELGNRDEAQSLNADAFRFGLDPYNQRTNGYVFEVTASNVQSELFIDDYTYDAVWQSAVHISDKGWSVEMKIPYSAFRFPAKKDQLWGIQFARQIRRNREYDQWTLTPKNVQNKMIFWGTLEGISNVEPPLRLSITPYLSLYGEQAPRFTSNGVDGYENSYSYSGGADLKVGLDERFTLDVTLLPDFSQVQSDNKVKNLTAYETVYDEKRPFFKEGVDLFSKGNLFYSRRIGKTPSLFYSIPYLLNEGDVIEENPDKAHLINATKLSGRTDKGLGVGILNAVTGTTYAKIKRSNGEELRIATEPLSNYNIFVLDQNLANNSEIFIANTTVLREGSEKDANVTTGQGTFENKKHNYRLTGRVSHSRINQSNADDAGNLSKQIISGNQYSMLMDKISGPSQYGGSYEVCEKTYDKNDCGVLQTRDYSFANAYYTYYLFNPFWKHFKQANFSVSMSRSGKLSLQNRLTNFQTNLSIFLLFNNNWSVYADGGSSPIDGSDFYEPRTAGRFFLTRPSTYGSLNITTNYNKKLAFDFGARSSRIPAFDNLSYGYYVVPILRISDQWSFRFSYFWDVYTNDIGFANFADAEGLEPIFGSRKIYTIENTLTTRYLFKNDMSLSFTARHYWSQGKYKQFYLLREDGGITDTYWNGNEDFNSSYFNIDLVYNWQFAPGSSFLVTYKNAIFSDNQDVTQAYFPNLKHTIDDPQTNSISLKILYYLDYQNLVKKKAA